MTLLVVVTTLLCYQKSNSTQESFSADLNGFYAFVDDLNQKNILDGHVLVVQGDDILFHRQSNYIASSAQDPQFMIASISKHFTAVALLRALYDSSPGLDEAEKCDWVVKQLHVPIITFLTPERFAWGSTIPVWAHHVTLHHLLSHTSGIVQYVRLMFEREGYQAVDSFFCKSHSTAEIVQKWGHEPLQFIPGSGYSYSNLGYELLAQVISIVASMPFSEYLQKHIFIPNGMNSTYNPTCGSSHDLKQLPSCSRLVPEMFYDCTSEISEPIIPAHDILCDYGSAQGSGGIISTAHDLWRWNRALHEFKSVLPAPLYALLIHPKYEFNKHAYGVWNRNGIIHTTGRYGSYNSQLLYIAQHNISVVLLCHIDRDEAALYKKCEEIDAELCKSIEDKNERHLRVNEILKKQYPMMRGAGLMREYIHTLVDSIDPR